MGIYATSVEKCIKSCKNVVFLRREFCKTLEKNENMCYTKITIIYD